MAKLTDRQMVALFGLYQGVLKNYRTVYGVNVVSALATLADRGIIARTGVGTYMIPWGSPGAQIISDHADFIISAHL